MNAASFPAAAESSASGPALVVRDLEHAFATRTVLEGVSLRLPAGETLALVGPSGCGKSTLLHLCAGLLDVRSGEIHNGFARTAMLFQQPTLLPWKTTLDNIALGLKAQGVPGRERLAQATRMGNLLGLDDVALAQFPHQLSGGMQSRAALARALVLSPDLLLLDEPFAALDIGLKAQMHQLLMQEQRSRGLAVLMITHDVTEAVTLADRVLVMAANPCPCGQYGNPNGRCQCPPMAVRRYLARISGPLLDRIDLQQTVRPVRQSLLAQAPPGESSGTVRERVAQARQRQARRLAGTGWTTNAEVSGSFLRMSLPLPLGIEMIDQAVAHGSLTSRGVDRVLRVAWTVCDLAGADRPTSDHLRLALAMRRGETVGAAA